MSDKHSGYNSEIAEKICELLSGGMSLVTICKQPDMPSRATVFVWLSKNKEFQDSYALAREAWADAIFEEILEISDDSDNDTTTNERGTLVANHEWIARARLRVDTRKWALARMSPKKYGERNTTDLNVTDNTKALSEEQKATRVQAIFDRAQKRKEKDDISDLC